MHGAIKANPERQALINLTPAFIQSLDLSLMIDSKVKGERELALAFCDQLLNSSDSEVKLVDLVQYDVQARDLLFND